MRQKQYFNFLSYFLLSLLILLIGIISFNIIVDYTGVFGSKIIPKNIVLKSDNRRIVTPGVIRSYKPTIIITGTSRVGRAIDPSHPIFINKKALNLFYSGGDANELSHLLNFASIIAPPKQVVLGIDFFSFDEDLDIEDYTINFRPFNYQNNSVITRAFKNIDLILSKDALRANLSSLKTKKTIFSEYSKKSFHDRNGRKTDISLLDDTYDKASQVRNLIHVDMSGHGYLNYKFSDEKLNGLIQSLERLKTQGVEIKLFMSPIHVYFLETIFQLGLFPEYSRILAAMSKLSDDPLVEFYDFSGFNEVTIGKKNDKVNGYYPDGGHYSVEVGDQILEVMFNKTDLNKNNFGKLVTSKNFQEHLNNLYQERLTWRSKNFNDAKLLDNLIKLKNTTIDKEEVMKLVTHYFYRPQLIKSNNSPQVITYCDEQQKMAYIEAGDTLIGALPNESSIDFLPISRVKVDAYCIDVNEVTNFDYQNAGFELHKKTPQQFRNNEQPVVNINWLQAQEFCHLKEKRLPTEAEWVKAAKGADERRFPWGNSWPSCQVANYNGVPGQGCGTSSTSNVGTKIKGVSPYGLFDMAGNVFEFVHIRTDDSIIKDQLIKGGSWSSERQHLPISYRRITGIDVIGKHIGFRCAKNID